MNDVRVNVFDLNFSGLLLKKLKNLYKEDRVFVIGNMQAKKEKNRRETVTPISRLVILHLSKQLGVNGNETSHTYQDLTEFITTAEEFIKIFRKTVVTQPE
jgi:hypothetical protein